MIKKTAFFTRKIPSNNCTVVWQLEIHINILNVISERSHNASVNTKESCASISCLYHLHRKGPKFSEISIKYKRYNYKNAFESVVSNSLAILFKGKCVQSVVVMHIMVLAMYLWTITHPPYPIRREWSVMRSVKSISRLTCI